MNQTGDWYATTAPENKYQYNGIVLDEATGLYDYGKRYYDPAIARWGQVDPKADKYSEWSPYNSVLINPVGNTNLPCNTFRFSVKQ